MVAEVRAFNRFYTREIGILRENFLDAGLNLPKTRVLYEIANHKPVTATDVARRLRMDSGYLSRVLQKLQRRRLVTRETSTSDTRKSFLALTARGEQQFALQNRLQNEEVEKLLSKLAPADQEQLLASMKIIQRVLGSEAASSAGNTFILRAPRLGDMGWVLLRHGEGEGYTSALGWDERFVALVARIIADFETFHDPAKERCWIAERHGERLGCVFLVKLLDRKGVAKLRLLWVEPSARGLGLGKALVQECTKFAQQAGYKKIVLFTNSELKAARSIYKSEGYKHVKSEPDPLFPKGQLAEEWELELPAAPQDTFASARVK